MESNDSMSYRQYTTKSEFDKAVHILEGILKGIAFDRAINESEIQELQNWCSLHSRFANKQPFNELIPLIEMSLEDRLLTKEEIDDILWVCNNFATGSIYYDMITSDIQRLQGILHGILSDNKINNEEILSLKEWLEQNDHLANTYPYDEVNSLITSVLSDCKIDESERNALKVFFSEFIDTKNSYNINMNEIEELKKDIKIQGVCAVCPSIDIKNSLFCFTGASSRSTRDKIAEVISSVGGRYHDNITKDTNYLVIGNNGNPCWCFSCYGRKVEKAMDMRKAGHKIIIIHENDFWDMIADIGA